MCDPVSLTVAATAVAAVGQGVGAMQQAAAYRYQAAVADRNSREIASNRNLTIEQNQIEQQRLGRKYAQLEGQQNAAMAANGIALDFGTARNIESDTQMFYREDQSQLSLQNLQELRSYDINAWSEKSKAAGARQAASGALVKGLFDTVGTVLGGASQVSSYRAKLKGPKTSSSIAPDYGSAASFAWN